MNASENTFLILLIILIIKFINGALWYLGIEVMWDGSTARIMGIVGGTAFTLCGFYDEWFHNLPMVLIWILVGLTVVLLELVSGLIFNKDYHIWDYRKMPFNYKGQICATFFLIWCFPIAPVILFLNNWIDMIAKLIINNL